MSTTIDYFIGQVLYRVEDVVRIGMHDRHGHPHVTLRTFYVDRVTPQGAWICEGHPPEARVPGILEAISPRVHLRGFPKWVPKSTNRSIGLYVAPTIEQARANAVARREWHIRCLRRELEAAEHRVLVLQGYPLEYLR